MIDTFFKVLKGQTLNASTLNGAYFDAIYCDGAFTSIAAKAIVQSATRAANISSAVDGAYSATDAACMVMATPVVEGQFTEVYCNTLGDAVRVHLVRV